MKVDVERQEQNIANISIEIDHERATAEYNKACRRLSQRINIPGFRRGKAPRQVIEKTIGVDKLKQEVLDKMLPHAFADAISEHQLDVIAPPTVQELEYEVGKPVKVKASVELRPEVSLPEVKSLNVTVPRYQEPEGAMQAELDAMLQRMTTLEPVIDRPAQADDIVNINFAGAVNGELIRGGSADNFQLDLANNNFIEGFAAQIPGHKIGEEFTIDVNFPEDYHDNTLKGKPAVFTIKINEIKKKVMPELNDDTVQKIGPYQTVDELKAAVQKFLDEKAEEENRFRAQKVVIDEYVKQVKVELPASLLARETQVLWNDVEQRFKSQGLAWEQYVQAEGRDNLMATFGEEAQSRLRTSLTFSAIAKAEGIQVTQEEYQAEVGNVARMRGADEKAVFRELANNPQALQATLDHMVSQKVVTWLMDKAKIDYVDAPADEPANAFEKAVEVAGELNQENYEASAAE